MDVYADDASVQTGDGDLVVGGRDEPEDVDVSDVPELENRDEEQV